MPVAFRYDLPEIYKIARMRHRVMLCHMDDVVEQNGEMSLKREGIREVWANITDRRGSMISQQGYTIMEPEKQVSHFITTRYMYDLDIRSTAWIYEKRLKSPPRWFKVLEITDHRLVYLFAVHIVERSDAATPPVASTPGIAEPIPLPPGVKL